VLRPRPAARLTGRTDLHLRVHVLRRVRRAAARRRVPELRRRVRAAAGPAAGDVGQAPRLDRAGARAAELLAARQRLVRLARRHVSRRSARKLALERSREDVPRAAIGPSGGCPGVRHPRWAAWVGPAGRRRLGHLLLGRRDLRPSVPKIRGGLPPASLGGPGSTIAASPTLRETSGHFLLAKAVAHQRPGQPRWTRTRIRCDPSARQVLKSLMRSINVEAHAPSEATAEPAGGPLLTNASGR
jgi:hypothetical protein